MNQKSLEVSRSKKHSEKPSGSGAESWLPVLLGILINPFLFLAVVPKSVSLPKENPESGPEAILMQPPRCPGGTSSWLVRG